MTQESKQIAAQADRLSDVMRRIKSLLNEDVFADLWERTNEAEALLEKVISESSSGTAGEFRLY